MQFIAKNLKLFEPKRKNTHSYCAPLRGEASSFSGWLNRYVSCAGVAISVSILAIHFIFRVKVLPMAVVFFLVLNSELFLSLSH